MDDESPSIDVATMPELARLAHEVAATGRPLVLRENGTELAVLAPLSTEERIRAFKPSPEAIERALAAVGGWVGLVDPEEFKRQRRELQVHDRDIPPL
jgi:hypothetical protein